MIVIGLLLVAAAVAATVVLIAQNTSPEVTFKALGDTYTVHLYWVLVAGMVLLAVAAIGLSAMRAGTASSWRSRRERRQLAAENARLSKHLRDAIPPMATTGARDERAAYEAGRHDETRYDQPTYSAAPMADSRTADSRMDDGRMPEGGMSEDPAMAGSRSSMSDAPKRSMFHRHRTV
ncbi:MAG: hypothetical protein JO147_09630 [Actinobacteria bacterium]|nr:hypothetical protein [Actinomycetota bacterium]